MSDTDSSGLSSPLSSVRGSLSPPPELSMLVTPPASQNPSDAGSPGPEVMNPATKRRSADGSPPAKRRRVDKPRTTEYLDLRRSQLDEVQQTQMRRLLDLLHKRRKIVVVAGAGISVSAGIPDFRSSTGLFTSLRAEHNLKGSGKHLFDASVYKDDSSTTSFHDMVRNLSKQTENAQPTPFHNMLASLAQKDRLLRLYTQNVDGIDVKMPPLNTTVPLKKRADGTWPRAVQLHGGLDKMVCSKCGNLDNFEADDFTGPVPPSCALCMMNDEARTAAGMRSHGIGLMRPRMVLYNEHNPDEEAIGRVAQHDLRKRPDAIIVVGTSLKIPGVRRIVKEMCGVVRDRRDGLAVWINNDPEPTGIEFKDCWDIVVRGTCDEVARRAALRPWDDQDSGELTEDEWVAMTKESETIKVNSTFHGLSSKKRFQEPSSSPDFSPMKDRHWITQPDIDTTDSECFLGAPMTPSKSARNSPAKKRTVAAAFNLGDNKPLLNLKATNKAKTLKGPASSKAKSKTTSKAAAPKTARKSKEAQPMRPLNQTFKLSKSASIAAASSKTKQSPKKAKHVRSSGQSVAMQPLSPSSARRNSPGKPTSSPGKVKPVARFPGLSKPLADGPDQRMAIASIIAS